MADEIWNTLSITYANPSRIHVKQLRSHFKSWKKGNKSIHEYFKGFTTHFDELALLGKPVEREEHIEYILEGLSEEYKPVIDQIEGRDITPTLPRFMNAFSTMNCVYLLPFRIKHHHNCEQCVVLWPQKQQELSQPIMIWEPES